VKRTLLSQTVCVRLKSLWRNWPQSYQNNAKRPLRSSKSFKITNVGNYRKTEIRLVQHCTVISAIAKLLVIPVLRFASSLYSCVEVAIFGALVPRTSRTCYGGSIASTGHHLGKFLKLKRPCACILTHTTAAKLTSSITHAGLLEFGGLFRLFFRIPVNLRDW